MLTGIQDSTDVKNISRIYRLGGTVWARLRPHSLQEVNGNALRRCTLRLCDKLTSASSVTTPRRTIRVLTHWYGWSKNLSTRDLVYTACFLNPEKGAHVGQYFTSWKGSQHIRQQY